VIEQKLATFVGVELPVWLLPLRFCDCCSKGAFGWARRFSAAIQRALASEEDAPETPNSIVLQLLRAYRWAILAAIPFPHAATFRPASDYAMEAVEALRRPGAEHF